MKLKIFVIISILLLTVSVVWMNRAGFINNFDYQYVRYFYDHSHWTVPASKRKMGDALLYQIAGYELVTKSSFTEINPEAPPLSKYLMGWSIVLTGSALWVNILLFILLLFFCYHVSQKVLEKKWHSWLALILIAWQPLIWQQLYQSMLDLGQVTWLMGWLWFTLRVIESKFNRQQLLDSLLAGVCLGLFVSTKIAFFIAPLIFFVGSWLIYLKRIKGLFLILLTTGLVYSLMYLPHLVHAGFYEAVGLQKWILHYWLSSSSRPIYGITLIVLGTGWYLGHWQQASWTWLGVWNPVWLVGSYGLASLGIKSIANHKKITLSQKTLLFCFFALIISLLLVPLFERYLVIILPILVINSVWIITRLKLVSKKYILILLVAWTFIQSFLLIPPSVSETAKEISRVASVPSYQDLWLFLDENTQKEISQKNFWQELEAVRNQGSLKEVVWDIQLPKSVINWQTKVPVAVNVKQTTEIGDLNFQVQTNLIRKDGKWSLFWQPDLFLPGWRHGDQLLTDFHLQNGQVINQDGRILASDGETIGLNIVPGKIKDEIAFNNTIEVLTGISKPNQELFYKVGQYPDLKYYLAPVYPDFQQNFASQTDPAISFQAHPGRVYSSIIKFDREKVLKLIEIEKSEKNLLKKPYGQLWVVNPNNSAENKLLLSISPQETHNLTLNYDFFQKK